MAAVDEHRELDRTGPAELEQRVERGARRAPGEQHVVDEHDDLVAHVGHLGRAERRDRTQADVVAVERDVERAVDGLAVLERRDRRGQAPRQRNAARVQADEHDVLGAVIALDDLVRDASQRPAEIGGVEDLRPQYLGRVRAHQICGPIRARAFATPP